MYGPSICCGAGVVEVMIRVALGAARAQHALRAAKSLPAMTISRSTRAVCWRCNRQEVGVLPQPFLDEYSSSSHERPPRPVQYAFVRADRPRVCRLGNDRQCRRGRAAADHRRETGPRSSPPSSTTESSPAGTPRRSPMVAPRCWLPPQRWRSSCGVDADGALAAAARPPGPTPAHAYRPIPADRKVLKKSVSRCMKSASSR